MCIAYNGYMNMDVDVNNVALLDNISYNTDTEIPIRNLQRINSTCKADRVLILKVIDWTPLSQWEEASAEINWQTEFFCF